MPGGEKGTAPPTAALLAAVRYAHAKGVTIGAQVSWSDDLAMDIITVAQEARVAWILIGYHRAASGSDTMGGVVREVFAKGKVLPINVGVFIQGTDRPIERVFAAVDSSPDGRASLALGVRIAQGNKCCMSSEPFGQVSERFKRESGPSGLKSRLSPDGAAAVLTR